MEGLEYLTDEQREQFQELSQEFVRFINDNLNPETVVTFTRCSVSTSMDEELALED
jgi:hypothetical protein